MKIGACDYLTKPVENGPLIAAVNRAIDMRALRRENETLKAYLLSDVPSPPKAFCSIAEASW